MYKITLVYSVFSYILILLGTYSIAAEDSTEENWIKKSFVCPISKGIMQYPVVAEDGASYEKKSLEDLFNTDPIVKIFKSPVTGEMIPKRFIKNTVLQDLIKSWKIYKLRMGIGIDRSNLGIVAELPLNVQAARRLQLRGIDIPLKAKGHEDVYESFL